MTLWIDRCINLFQYPVALLAGISFPFWAKSVLLLLLDSFQGDGIYFWMGAVSYLSVWKIFFSQRYVGSFLPTLVHELIHALFAILTLHRVVGMMVRWDKGGHIQYVGGTGNWLITIAPYFFPLAFSVMVVLSFVIDIPSPEKEICFGVVWGFETMVQWKQLHREQPDLHEVGFLFATLFLPTTICISQCLIFGLMFRGVAILPQLWSKWLLYLQNLFIWMEAMI